MYAPAMECCALDAEALDVLLSRWSREAHGFSLLALLPEAEKHKLPLLQGVCKELGIALHGAIFPRLLRDAEFLSEGLALFRLPADAPAAVVSALGASAENDGQRMAATIGNWLSDEQAPTPTLLMVFDAMVPKIGSILDSLYLELADRVHYSGVNAGSETFQPMPCVFDLQGCYENSVLCLLLKQVPGAAMAHGYAVPQRLVTATSTEGNRIDSLNWQPAFSMYRELIASEYGIGDLTQENFYQYACHFPFGILRADDEVIVRIPVALTEDGSLYCVGEVPANSTLVLLRAPSPVATTCVQEIKGQLQRLHEQAPSALLSFYCAGRRMHMGEGALSELQDLSESLGRVPLLGALSLGEIGSGLAWAYPCFHNATIVVMPWAEV